MRCLVMLLPPSNLLSASSAAVRSAVVLWPDDAIGYATFYSRSHDAVIHVYDAADNVIETQEHKGELKE